MIGMKRFQDGPIEVQCASDGCGFFILLPWISIDPNFQNWLCVKNLRTLVNSKIASKWMFIPLKYGILIYKRFWSIANSTWFDIPLLSMKDLDFTNSCAPLEVAMPKSSGDWNDNDMGIPRPVIHCVQWRVPPINMPMVSGDAHISHQFWWQILRLVY